MKLHLLSCNALLISQKLRLKQFSLAKFHSRGGLRFPSALEDTKGMLPIMLADI